MDDGGEWRLPEPADGRFDVVVVGGGIVGLAVARELSRRRPRARLAVLEREPEVGRQQTAHNSGVIHAGIYYRPGSLKARLCVAGARELFDYCDARGVRAERPGKVIVATRPEEVERLDELERRGRANGVPGLRRLDPHGLAEIEPRARGLAALHSPSTGIVDYAAVARAMAGDVRDADGQVITGCEVREVAAGPRGVRVRHVRGELEAGFAVLCAGSAADRLARTAGADPDPAIVPFRGAYSRLRGDGAALVRSMIYPVPDPSLPFLGVHLTRHGGDEVLVGPTALLAGARDAHPPRAFDVRDTASTFAWPGTWRMARTWWRTGIGEIARAASRRALAAEAARFVPALREEDLEPAFFGVRAQAVARDGRLLDDFAVSETPRALHVRNAPSPAATSALALARLVADRAEAALS
ncbi:MAG: L-2-hydroxyglutarate oxidase [Thermoleophilaceae bacterium]